MPNTNKSGSILIEPLNNNFVQYINLCHIKSITDVFVPYLFQLTHVEEPMIIFDFLSITIIN